MQSCAYTIMQSQRKRRAPHCSDSPSVSSSPFSDHSDDSPILLSPQSSPVLLKRNKRISDDAFTFIDRDDDTLLLTPQHSPLNVVKEANSPRKIDANFHGNVSRRLLPQFPKIVEYSAFASSKEEEKYQMPHTTLLSPECQQSQHNDAALENDDETEVMLMSPPRVPDVQLLPDELILKILGNITSPVDLSECRRVCRQWRHVAEEDCLWRSLCQRRLSCPEGGTQTSVKNARTHFEGAQTTAIAFHLSRRCRDDTSVIVDKRFVDASTLRKDNTLQCVLETAGRCAENDHRELLVHIQRDFRVETFEELVKASVAGQNPALFQFAVLLGRRTCFHHPTLHAAFHSMGLRQMAIHALHPEILSTMMKEDLLLPITEHDLVEVVRGGRENLDGFLMILSHCSFESMQAVRCAAELQRASFLNAMLEKKWGKGRENELISMFSHCCSENHMECVPVFHKFGFSLPEHVFAQLIRMNKWEVACLILDSGWTPHVGPTFRNALMRSVSKRVPLSLFRRMIQISSRTMIREVLFETIRSVEPSAGAIAYLRLILEYDSSYANERQYAEEPLHVACDIPDIEVVQLLLSYGADPNAVRGRMFGDDAAIHGLSCSSADDAGKTPLEIAAMRSDLGVVQILCEGGATVTERIRDNIASKFSSSPVHAHKRIIHFLKKWSKKHS